MHGVQSNSSAKVDNNYYNYNYNYISNSTNTHK